MAAVPSFEASFTTMISSVSGTSRSRPTTAAIVPSSSYAGTMTDSFDPLTSAPQWR